MGVPVGDRGLRVEPLGGRAVTAPSLSWPAVAGGGGGLIRGFGAGGWGSGGRLLFLQSKKKGLAEQGLSAAMHYLLFTFFQMPGLRF